MISAASPVSSRFAVWLMSSRTSTLRQTPVAQSVLPSPLTLSKRFAKPPELYPFKSKGILIGAAEYMK